MNKQNAIQQPLADSPENGSKKLSIAPLSSLAIDSETYVGDQSSTTIMSKYAGSIEFSDDEFSAMLQELKEDR